jgi:hypothetical protein
MGARSARLVMRRCGTRSMPAFRSVVSVLVSFVVRSFSTNSRPALRAAACGGRPRPAQASSALGYHNDPTVSIYQYTFG